MILAHEEEELEIMVNQEVERITKEIDGKPFKCQQLIRWMKSNKNTKLIHNGVKYQITMMMHVNLVVTKNKLIEATRYQEVEMTKKVVALKYASRT